MNGSRPSAPVPWDEPTRVKVERELWRLAREVLQLGPSVVLDLGLWARVERDEMRTVARDLGVGVELHYLDVPTDELWRRIELRNAEPTLGHATRSIAPTSTDGYRCFRRPTQPSWRCSTLHRTRTEPRRVA